MTEINTNDLIDPLLEKMLEECNLLTSFLKTKDFPYHKLQMYETIVAHTSSILLLAGEIKAIKILENHTITETPYSDTQYILIENLENCNI